ncbi:MAG: alcohol dehydrogenase catalytic domain-containing protein [Candidatus Dormibacteria bacterium]
MPMFHNQEEMKAVIKSSPGPGFTEVDVPIPVPGTSDVRIRVEAASICGTDIHLYDWNPWAAGRVVPPRIMGHEICGVIDAIGSGVTDRSIGMRVAVESHIVCRTCPECLRGEFHVCRNTSILGVDRDGGFADYIVVPAVNTWPLWNGCDPAVGAAMEPVGNAVHATSIADLSGSTVVVMGAGPIGCACCAIARAKGASFIVAIDRSPFRASLAKTMGADVGCTLEAGTSMEKQLSQVLGEREVDGVLEMSGAVEAIQTAVHLVRPGGWISMLGLGDSPVEVDFSTDVVMRGLTLYGIVGRELFATWEETTRLIRTGAISMDSLITDRLPFTGAAIDEAVRKLKKGTSGKIVLTREGEQHD